MYLSRLYIENYRSIQKVDLKFERGKNIIVGRNNSGKSNIIKAIDLVLGEYSPTYNKSENITDNDFYCGNTTVPIFIWCEINRDVTEANVLENIDFSGVEKSAFLRVFEDRSFTREIRVPIASFTDSEKNSIFEFSSEEGQVKIDNNQVYKKWIGGKPYCKATFNDEFSDKSRFAIAFTCFYNEEEKLEKELVFLYKENDESQWIHGLNCNLRNTLIQSAIIPAFRDPKDQLRINTYTWFGKLLKTYVKGGSTDLNNAFDAVKTASNELFQGLKDKISKKEVDVAFPNTTISFQFNPDTKQDIHKSTLIYVNDGFNSELKDKGAGIQSAIIISLFDFYVRNIAHSGSSLLAIEEPELYLHPHGRRVISNRLSKFIDNGKNQVIITTHSPEFVSSIHENQNIISVRKDTVSSLATNIYFNTPKRKQILIKKQNAEIFFSDAVILSEGAEKYLIEEASKYYGNITKIDKGDGNFIPLGENWINDYNISIINCGGKDELWKYAEILKELKIKYITTADFDFLREGLSVYFSNLQFEQQLIDNLNALKSKIIATIGNNYKSLSQLHEPTLISEVQAYLNKLHDKNIFIFSGELENFYKIKPSLNKEAGVIETIGKCIATEKPISDFVDIREYNLMFTLCISSIFGWKLQHL